MDDSCVFVVRSRGKQKDFSDEKLQEIKHHLEETLDGKASEVVFEPIMADVERAERIANRKMSEKSLLNMLPSSKALAASFKSPSKTPSRPAVDQTPMAQARPAADSSETAQSADSRVVDFAHHGTCSC